MLAPMEGVTHPTLRNILAEQGGIGIVCTEFVRISRGPLSLKALKREVVKTPGHPLCVQVMGTDADKMAEAAEIVALAGADVVDINLGCPAPKAVRSGAGSAMLKNPDLLYKVLCSMRKRVPGLLSAKIRAGFDNADHIVEIGQVVEAAGADYITVHPRKRTDYYEGIADWRPIKMLVDALSIPVIGNGDVWYAKDALRMEKETGCAGVMIGRPALRNPWIFQQIDDLRNNRTPCSPSGLELCDFIEMVFDRYEVAFPKCRKGPIGKLKELISYLTRAIDDQRETRKLCLRAQEISQIREILRTRIAPLPAEAIDLAAHTSLALENPGTI
jgi:tRNA-dihydrouridine synthase B